MLLSRYRIVDSARKVVGVGSVGTGCWVILLQGIDSDDPLFLQVKQAQASVLAPYVDDKLRSSNQGRRVVVGQRLTQGSPDIFLGWGDGEGQGLLHSPARRHEGQRQVRRERSEQHRRLRRILRAVRLGAGAGACQVRRSGDDRRLLRQQRRTGRGDRQVRAWPMPGRPTRTTTRSTRRAAAAASGSRRRRW